MCTDKTAKSHIANYIALCDEIKRLETLKKSESAWIIGELNNRGVQEFGGVKVYDKSRTMYPEKNLITFFGDKFESVKSQLASVSTWQELRRVKA